MHSVIKEIGWGLGGVYMKGVTDSGMEVSVTTYSKPSYFLEEFNSGCYQKDRPTDTFEGAIVIDKEKALEENPRLAVKSPLFDPTLKDNEIRIALTTKSFEGTLADTQSSLDSVGLNIYLEYWKQYSVRLGKVVNGKIIWNENSD